MKKKFDSQEQQTLYEKAVLSGDLLKNDSSPMGNAFRMGMNNETYPKDWKYYPFWVAGKEYKRKMAV